MNVRLYTVEVSNWPLGRIWPSTMISEGRMNFVLEMGCVREFVRDTMFHIVSRQYSN